MAEILTCAVVAEVNDVLTVTKNAIWRWDGTTGEVKTKFTVKLEDGDSIASFTMSNVALSNGMPPQIVIKCEEDYFPGLFYPLEKLISNTKGGTLAKFTKKKMGGEETEYLKLTSFSPDGKYLLGFSDEDELHVIDLKKSLSKKSLFSVPDQVESSFPGLFSPDSKRLLTSGDLNDELILWDVTKKKKLAKTGMFTDNDKPTIDEGELVPMFSCASFIPKSDYIASGLSNGIVQIRDAKTLQMQREVRLHKPRTRNSHLGLSTIKATEDGRHIITCGADTWVRIWTTQELREVARYHVGADVIGMAVLTSADGRTVLHCADGIGRNTVLDVNLD